MFFFFGNYFSLDLTIAELLDYNRHFNHYLSKRKPTNHNLI